MDLSSERLLALVRATLCVAVIASAFPAISVSASSTDTANARCRAIAHMNLPHVAITAAGPVTTGSFFEPPLKKPITNLPPFCRVAATLKPTPDSNIKIELWMPEENWNGRFLGTGNGGGGGHIFYGELVLGLRRGYATANTDMGTSPTASAMVGHPERWQNTVDTSTHEMTTVAKAILAHYFGKSQTHSYFFGCSTGGGQALMEAHRHPADYNGIIAGAPANNRTHIHTVDLWNWKSMNEVPGALLSTEKIAWVTKHIVAACAGKDGGSPQDDFLTDPRECKFNFDSLPICHANEQSDCITEVQLNALKKAFAGPTNPRTGERIYAPMPLGSESSPAGLASLEITAKIRNQIYPYQWVFGADFDPAKFDFDRQQDVLDRQLARYLNANNPDLSALNKMGGKILMFTGTADPLVSYPDTVNYYDRVVEYEQLRVKKHNQKQALAQTQAFFRYFLVPGMGHCGGGPGLHEFGQELKLNVPLDSSHDLLTALVDWVEQGKVPDSLIATKYVDDEPEKGIILQRPIFPYPKFPDYVGGDWKSASSYKCTEHPMGMVPTPAKRYLN